MAGLVIFLIPPSEAGGELTHSCLLGCFAMIWEMETVGELVRERREGRELRRELEGIGGEYVV